MNKSVPTLLSFKIFHFLFVVQQQVRSGKQASAIFVEMKIAISPSCNDKLVIVLAQEILTGIHFD